MRAIENKETKALLKSIVEELREIKKWLQLSAKIRIKTTINHESWEDISKFADDFYETVLKPIKQHQRRNTK